MSTRIPDSSQIFVLMANDPAPTRSKSHSDRGSTSSLFGRSGPGLGTDPTAERGGCAQVP